MVVNILRRTAAHSAIVLAATILAAPIVLAQEVQPEHGTGRVSKAAVTASRHMIAAANPVASQAGHDVLLAGGNAIDAAIAVQFMLNLVEPQSSGIGGGAFLVYFDAATSTLTTFDGRETAPAAAMPDYFIGADGKPMKFFKAVPGGRSVGVPGTLKLLQVIHDKYGSKPWSDLIMPTAKLARDGFAISPRMAGSIARSAEYGLDAFPAARAYFFSADGAPKSAGTILKNPDFAATLETIAEKGAAAFYAGPVGEALVATIRSSPVNPGLMTLQDLAAYKIVERSPVCMAYRGYDVCGMGPPSSGALTVGQILAMLSHFDLPSMGAGVDAVHLIAEASKRAFADRGLYMADADHVRVPVAGLLDPAYMTFRAQGIDRLMTTGRAKAGNPPWKDAVNRAADLSPDRPGTSHFVIVDRQGNAVSMTTTIETGFGSRLMTGGFLLNNEMTDFSFVPQRNGRMVANRVAGGKRPRSSMAPTIVMKNGKPYLLVGSPGGSRIIGYVAKTLIAILDWGMDPQAAIDLGHFINRNGDTDLEQNTAVAAMKDDLESRGHKVKIRDLNSGLHAILIAPDKLIGGADPRREGLVLGQ